MKLQTSEKIDIKSYIPIVIAIIAIAGLIGTAIDMFRHGYGYHTWFLVFIIVSSIALGLYFYFLYQNTKEG